MKTFGHAFLDEAAPMEVFIGKLRTWQRQRLQVHVPVLQAGAPFQEEVLVFDGDLRQLKPDGAPVDEAVVAYSLATVRQLLNRTEPWSAVVAIAQRLLEAPAKPWQHGEAVELHECDVLSLMACSVDFGRA